MQDITCHNLIIVSASWSHKKQLSNTFLDQGWSAVFDLSLIFDLSSIFPMEKSHLSRNLDLSRKQHSTPDVYNDAC